MSKGRKSILVIGSFGHKNATCIDWGELAYVGDFDYLIVNTTSLSIEMLRSILKEDHVYFEKLRKDIADVQPKKELAITCIVSPHIFSKDLSDTDTKEIFLKIAHNYSWSPIIPILESIPEAIRISKNGCKIPLDYFNKIKSYQLLYSDSKNNTGYVDKSPNNNFYTKCYEYSLLKNDAGRDVAFEIRWKLHRDYDSNVHLESKLPIEFIPPSETVEEGINILISEFFKTPEIRAPDWINEISLPGEKQIESEIATRHQVVEGLKDEIKNLEQKHEDLSEYKKLLYSQGTELEEVVEKAFNLLELPLTQPDVSNEEDRFYTTPDNKKLYVEIRGVNRLMNEKDLSQIIKRVAEKPASNIYITRGVFVFNHQNTKRPMEREEAFHPNIEKKAKVFQVCLLDTKTLFMLVEAKLKGEPFELANQLLNTSGIFKVT